MSRPDPVQQDDLPATRYFADPILGDGGFPSHGMPARDAYGLIRLGLRIDGEPSMNLASFVTTWMEPEAEQLIGEALRTNHIDHEEYPVAELIEQACVRMLADLWHAPDPAAAVGVATVGSSEAIMLGLLAHKFTWRAAREAAGLPADRPNIVYGAETHVVWDKFARYFDVEARKVPMRADRWVLRAEDVEPLVDERTIAVGAVLGTTFTGQNDPVGEIDELLRKIRDTRGWDVPIHVDGASGGFVAPFSHPEEQWDFRLEQVRSVNASGHKYGLVYPGVGWLVFRDRSALPEELVFSVNYLGGAQPTYTFNFSRPSAMIQAQLYQFLRLGRRGYEAVVHNMLANAAFLNSELERMGRFEVMNPELPEPVVTFRLRDASDFDEYHLADRLRMHGWIVPAYTLPPDAEDVSVLRVVVRNDMSRSKLAMLVRHIEEACSYLDGRGMPATEPSRRTDVHQRRRC